MRKRDVMWAKLTDGKRKKLVRTRRCMISFAIDTVARELPMMLAWVKDSQARVVEL